MKTLKLLVMSCLLGGSSFILAADIMITATNPLSEPWEAAPIVIDRAELRLPDGHTVAALENKNGGHDWEVPFQLDDLDGDGVWDELFFQTDLPASGKIAITLKSGENVPPNKFTKRVDATIETHPREPWQVYKPAWESELMTYCTYGAAQVDVIAKIIPRLTIDYFYGDEPHSQHQFSTEYGHDFLLTANTMAAHAIFLQEDGKVYRPWTTNSYSIRKEIEPDAGYESEVVSDGPLRAIVRTRISNWQTEQSTFKCDIIYSIASVTRYTTIEISLTPIETVANQIQLGAGMKQSAEDIAQETTSDYLMAVARNVPEQGILNRYIARGIIVPAKYEITSVKLPHDPSVTFAPNNGPNYGLLFPAGEFHLEYAFVSAWEKDDGITSVEQWRDYLSDISQRLSMPPVVGITRK